MNRRKYVYCKVQKKVVPIEERIIEEKPFKGFEFAYKRPKRGRWRWDREEQRLVPFSAPRAPQVHAVKQDTVLEPFASPLDESGAKRFDSMSAYKRHLKEHGYEITGGDHLNGRPAEDWHYEPDGREIREDALKAYYDIKYDRIPTKEN